MSTISDVEEHIRQTEAFLKQESELFEAGKWTNPNSRPGSDIPSTKNQKTSSDGLDPRWAHQGSMSRSQAEYSNRFDNPISNIETSEQLELESPQIKDTYHSKSLLEAFEQEGPFNIVPTPDHSSHGSSPEAKGLESRDPEPQCFAKEVDSTYSRYSSRYDPMKGANEKNSDLEPTSEKEFLSSEALVQSIIAKYREQERERKVASYLSKGYEVDRMYPISRTELADSSINYSQKQQEKVTPSKYNAKTKRNKPKVSRNSKRGSQRPGSKRVAKDEVAKKVHEERKKAFTFKPKINSDFIISKSRPSDMMGRINQIQEDYVLAREKREAEREKKIAEEYQTYTFRPNIKAHTREKGRNIPVEERLLERANGKLEERMRMKRELEQKRLEECTFAPRISFNSRKVARERALPIHRRLGEIERERKERIRKLRLSKTKEENAYHKPMISENSRILVENKRKGIEATLPVEDRLRSQLGTNILKKMKKLAQVEEEMRADLTFNPKLSENTTKIIEEKFKGREKEFYNRQLLYEDLKQARLKARIDEDHNRKGYTFKPDIGNADEILENSLVKRFSYKTESQDDVFERLAIKDREDLIANRDQLEREVYAGLDFRPKINETSKELVKRKRTDVYDLVYDEQREQARTEAKEIAEEKFRKECTFKPKMLLHSSKWQLPEDRISLTDSNGLLKRIEQRRKAKERQIQQAKAKKEVEAIKECTFCPETRKEPVRWPEKAVLVPGMARFLQTKELAKQIAEEKKMREDKVFNIKKSRRQLPYTIPQPFKLSSGTSKKKKKMILEKKLRNKMSKECTFRPQTLARTNRNLLKKIMSDCSNLKT